jgi:exonuclease SbcC
MQILSIRGKNIASLAQAFEIRLDQAPLATAGLFAITGETGAGKSSLLDAMCLALYGNCPRLSGEGTRESVDEADGQELKSNDPRMALRRGATDGYAEVAFIGIDGQGYEAAWSARRARGKIDGRLQSADRSLRRLSDGQVLDSQATSVNSRIVALTGLTYDEFRRTVLLAQGDFDAFLSAKTADRAAILEKVTGTGIYRDISRRIFDRYGAARAALETLEARRAEHRLLTPEQCAELAERVTALRVAQTADDVLAAGVLADLSAWRALSDAQARLATAAARSDAAERAVADLTPTRDWLAEWDAARILRGEVREVTEARAALSAAMAKRDDLAAKAAGQTAVLAGATLAVHSAIGARDEAEDRFKSFAEDWSRATELDAMITTATSEVAKAATEVDRLTGLRDQAAGRLGELTATQTRLELSVEGQLGALEAAPGYAALLTNWALIEERLESRIALSGQVAAETADRDALRLAISDDRTALEGLAQKIKAASDQMAQAQNAQAALSPERDALQAENPAARLQTLAQAAIDLQALRQAQGRVQAADTALADSQQRHDTATKAQADATTDQQTADRSRAEAARLIDALRRPTEAALAAASTEAEHLRRHLVAGQPCPVCHATEHPLMADSQIAALAADLRERLTLAEADRDRAHQAGLTALARQTQAATVITAETTRAPQLAQDVAQAETAFGTARAALLDHGIGAVPDDPRGPLAALEALAETLDTARSAASDAQARLAGLDRQHLSASQTIETARAEIAAAEASQRQKAEAIRATETTLAALDQSIPAATLEIARIDERLTPLLASFADQPDAYGTDGTEALDRLRTRVIHLQDLTTRLAQDRAALADLSPQFATAAEAANAATRAMTEAETTRTRRQTDLSTLTTERQALLGGEDTATHRTRHNEARKDAQTLLEAAQKQEADARALGARLTGAAAEAAEAAILAAERRSRADVALAEACALAALPLDRVLDLHAVPEAEVTARRQSLTLAATEQAEALGALRERQGELTALQTNPLPALSPEDLSAQQAAIEAATTARAEEQGRIAERLDADRLAGLALAGLESEIIAARQTAETWQAVNDAVGSASGDRFAQIAQAVTLAMLVERANLHLNDLKPRYQLEVAASDLALQVIDLDMAGDRRPARLLSGGERFLVSLALALALSGMGTQGALAGTLFIDEGFGSLDSDSLDLAIDALERLQAQGRMIGVISHVQAMKDRIPVQIEVRKIGGGASEVRLKVQ